MDYESLALADVPASILEPRRGKWQRLVLSLEPNKATRIPCQEYRDLYRQQVKILRAKKGLGIKVFTHQYRDPDGQLWLYVWRRE